MNTLSKTTLISALLALSLGAISSSVLAGQDGNQRMLTQQTIAKLQAEQKIVQADKLAECKRNMEQTQHQPKS